MPIESSPFDDDSEDFSEEGRGRGRRRKRPAFKTLILPPRENALAEDLRALAYCNTDKEREPLAQQACEAQRFVMKVPYLFTSCSKAETDKVFSALQRNGIGFYFTPYTHQVKDAGSPEVMLEYLKKSGEEARIGAGNKVEVDKTAFAIDAAQLKTFLESEPVVKLVKRCRDHEEAQKDKDPENFPQGAHFVPLRGGKERMALLDLEIKLRKMLAAKEASTGPWAERAKEDPRGSEERGR